MGAAAALGKTVHCFGCVPASLWLRSDTGVSCCRPASDWRSSAGRISLCMLWFRVLNKEEAVTQRAGSCGSVRPQQLASAAAGHLPLLPHGLGALGRNTVESCAKVFAGMVPDKLRLGLQIRSRFTHHPVRLPRAALSSGPAATTAVPLLRAWKGWEASLCPHPITACCNS